MKIEYSEIVKAELMANSITLCENCNNGCSHTRGSAFIRAREIHFNSKFQTRSTLFRFLHEVGHIVNGDVGRSYEQEYKATEYAKESFRCFGLPITHKLSREWNDYTKRKKTHGDNISKGRKAAL